MKSQEAKLHPRSLHHGKYNFKELVEAVPELKLHLTKNPNGETTIDFSNSESIKLLNSALLKSKYGIKYWDIPSGQLCPPIPGRADYIHYLADLLNWKDKDAISVLDIGTGANLIYPLLGCSIYKWNFVGSDVNENSLENAAKILSKNPQLHDMIELRLQSEPSFILKNIVKDNEQFDAVMCNPPFFKSEMDALAHNARKNKNLKSSQSFNFGGVDSELWCKGGEVEFIVKLFIESKEFKNQVQWFTCLVSDKENLKILERVSKKYQLGDLKIFKMSQGNKISRFIAWSFKAKL